MGLMARKDTNTTGLLDAFSAISAFSAANNYEILKREGRQAFAICRFINQALPWYLCHWRPSSDSRLDTRRNTSILKENSYEAGIIRVYLLLLSLIGLRVTAQTSARGAIDGIVTDTSFVALEGATAEIVGSRLSVRTGPNGRFQILRLASGDYLVTIRRLGYAPSTSVITIRDGDTTRVAIALRSVALELPRTLVIDRSLPPTLQEFEERRSRGVGQFMTESEIRKLNFTATSALLETFRSVEVTSTDLLNRRGFGLRPCPYRIFVDGVAITPVRGLDDYLPSPNELAGIEVHENSATVPLQYATFGGSSTRAWAGGGVCGVVLFWTKR